MEAPDIVSLKLTFETARTVNDWATAIVAAGVLIELIALLVFSKEMSRKEKLALALGSVLVVIGVAGEWIYGGRAADAAAQLQQASDERVAALGRDQAKDHKIAAQAADDAATLGLSVKGLHDFVASEENRNNAVIETLRRNTSDLKKARNDALIAANHAQADLARMNAALAAYEVARRKMDDRLSQRHLVPAQRSRLIAVLSKWAIVPGAGTFAGKNPLGGKQIGYVGPYPDTVEAGILADEIREVLKSAGWNSCCDSGPGHNHLMVGDLISYEPQVGLTVVVPKSPRSEEVGRALLSALQAAGLPATRYLESPNAGSDCEAGQKLLERFPDCAWVSVVVGEHP